MSDTYGFAALRVELTLDEGEKSKPYIDTSGNVTIGIGRNLTANGVSADEISLMFTNDVTAAESALDAGVPWWRTLDPVRQRVMLNMCFNMGWTVFSQFKRFFIFMKGGEWEEAGAAMQASLWWHQVGERAVRLQGMVLTGNPPAIPGEPNA